MRVFVEAEFPTTDVTSLSRGIYICQIKAMAIKPVKWPHESLESLQLWDCCGGTLDEAEIEPFWILDEHGQKLIFAILPPPLEFWDYAQGGGKISHKLKFGLIPLPSNSESM